MQLTAVLELISTMAVVVGVVYGLLQVRQYQGSRRRETALLVLNSFQTPGFIRGLIKVGQIPEGLGMTTLMDRVGEDFESVLILANTFERIGLLVYRRELPIDLVEDALTGPIIVSWRKLAPMVRDLRAEGHRGTALEWFQWLAERMLQRDREKPAVPAYKAHANWEA